MLSNHFQNAYVTPDIDRAVALLAERFGVTAEPMRIDVTQTFRTADGVGEGTLRLALIQLGRLEYELIQPLSGNVAIYADAVMPNQLLRFHHVGMRTDDFEQVRAESERHGRPIVLEGEAYGIRFLYADARQTLGHYLEYISAPDAYWEAMQQRGK